MPKTIASQAFSNIPDEGYKLECTTVFEEEGDRPLTCSLSYNAQKLQHDNTLGKEFPNSQNSYDINNIKPIQPFIISHQLVACDPQSFTLNYGPNNITRMTPNKKYFIEYTVLCNIPYSKLEVILSINDITFAPDAGFLGKLLYGAKETPNIDIGKERVYKFVVCLRPTSIFNIASLGTLSIKWKRTQRTEACEFIKVLPPCECLLPSCEVEMSAPKTGKKNEVFSIQYKISNTSNTLQYYSLVFDESILNDSFFFAGDYEISFTIQPMKCKVLQQCFLPYMEGNCRLPSFELVATECNDVKKIIAKDFCQFIWINP